MDRYVTGATIRRLREEKGLTQAGLALRLMVSDKTVSKWETGKGYPDITLLEPLAKALGISTMELLSGEDVKNANRTGNMARCNLYVCPVCGNVLFSMGGAAISCCGVALPPLCAEPEEDGHRMEIACVEDEWYVTLDHPMTKEHYISFIAGVYADGLEIIKLYPEGPASARLKRRGLRYVYAYCNRDGLYRRPAR